VHDRILGVKGKGSVTAEELWTFCSSGIGVKDD
jgi:hypothetical protein